MAILSFCYGTVGAGKTKELVEITQNYRAQGIPVYVLRPRLDPNDDRHIKSRSGGAIVPDFVLGPRTRIAPPAGSISIGGDQLALSSLKDASVIFVDEAQFLSEAQVDDLLRLTLTYDIPVRCYGLRTDFRSEMFQGAKRLFEVADEIHEQADVKCSKCDRKSSFNLRIKDGLPTFEGSQVHVGGLDTYRPVCKQCYLQASSFAGGASADG